MLTWSLLFLGVCTFFACAYQDEENCQIETYDQQDCAFGIIDEGECILRNCCWKPGYNPWCFKSKDLLYEQCMVTLTQANEKEECGYYGIKYHECSMRGCCWMPTNENNVPWCFKKPVPYTTTTTTTPNIIQTTEGGVDGWSRLIDDPLISARVEVYYNGEWGTVCDDNFDDRAAKVVCIENLYADGKFNRNSYGQGAGDDVVIWLDNFSCNGDEWILSECALYNRWGETDCSHSEDATVICYETVQPSGLTTEQPYSGTTEIGIEGETRLVGNISAAARVEIYHDGRWGTVCDDDVDDKVVLLVCAEHGYSFGVFYGSMPSDVVAPIWMDNFECNDEDERLADCTLINGWGQTDCTHDEDAGIRCYETEPTTPSMNETTEIGIEGETRLVGDVKFSARVEIYHDGRWGTVCDDNFDDFVAFIVCREHGYASGNVTVDVPIGDNMLIWMDNFSCHEGDEMLAECTLWDDWGVTDCSQSENAGVRCYETEQPSGLTTEIGIEGCLPLMILHKGHCIPDNYICPSNDSDSCYLLDLSNRDWLMAYDFCKSNFASLIIVETPKENKEVVDIIRNHTTGKTNWWLAGTDNLHEDSWMWVTDEGAIPIHYTDWKSSQPNNWRGISDYLALEVSSASGWYDAPENYGTGYSFNDMYTICEKNFTRY